MRQQLQFTPPPTGREGVLRAGNRNGPGGISGRSFGQHAAEKPRHKRPRGIAAISLGQRDRLIHSHRAGDIGVQQFKQGNAEDGPVGRSPLGAIELDS